MVARAKPLACWAPLGVRSIVTKPTDWPRRGTVRFAWSDGSNGQTPSTHAVAQSSPVVACRLSTRSARDLRGLAGSSVHVALCGATASPRSVLPRAVAPAARACALRNHGVPGNGGTDEHDPWPVLPRCD